jgi:alpha-mannosidase
MVDVFGSHPQIPQLMQKSGFSSYIFGRCMNDKKQSEFIWEGINKSRLLCVWTPLTCTNLWPVPGNPYEFDKKIKELAAELEKYSATKEILLMSGYDYSPPSPDLPVLAKNFRKKDVKLTIITLKDYMKVIQSYKKDLPVIKGDFNPIFQGCYSSRIGLKLKNRKLEYELDTCERMEAINLILNNGTKSDGQIEKAWEKVLFNHFHDVICCSHTDPVYREAQSDYAFAQNIIWQKKAAEIQELADSIDTHGKGIPVVVINSLAWRRTDVVEVEVTFAAENVWEVALVDHQSKPVPHQETCVERYANGSLKLLKMIFISRDIPACGYRVYHVLPNEKGAMFPKIIGKRLLKGNIEGVRGCYDGLGLVEIGEAENEYFKLKFDIKKGLFVSIKNKSGQEIINQKNALGNVISREIDEGDLWQYNEQLEGGETIAINRKFDFPEVGEADFSHLHQMAGMDKGDIKPGPVFAEIISEGRFGKGYRKIRARIYAGIPRIDIATTIVNNNESVRYRIHFPTAIQKGKIIREIPFGAIEQPEGEFPCQNWLDYANKSMGLGILNKGLPGQGVVNDVVMVSVLRSVAMPEEVQGERGEFEEALEKGKEYSFEYALVPHEGSWQDKQLPRKGYEFNSPLLAVKTTSHKGNLPPEGSFFEVAPANIIVSAVKRQKGNQGIIVRLYETDGKKTKAILKTRNKIVCIKETDLLEDNFTDTLAADTKSFAFTIMPFEIKTFLIKFGSSPILVHPSCS